MNHSQRCGCGQSEVSEEIKSIPFVGSRTMDGLHELSDLEAGLSIADKLVEEAIWSNGQCTFIGAIAPDEIGLPEKYGSFQGDVYEGTAGIARTLILANRLRPKVRYVETIKGALCFAHDHHEGFSLYSGSLGIGLVSLESGYDEFKELALELINSALDDAINSMDSAPADLLSGIAGVIYGVTEVLRITSDSGLMLKASVLANHLVNSGNRVTVGEQKEHSWCLYEGSADHLCGLAHGASGVALSLEALSRFTSDNEQWLDTAQAARNFERRWYSAQHGSWADLRSEALDENEPSVLHYPHMWCHGSVGIAAERLTAASNDILARADKVAAMEGILSHVQELLSGPRGAGGGDQINGSQCHGLASFTDLILDAWGQSKSIGLVGLVRQITALMKDDARRTKGLRSGVINGPSTPGLMMGDAGIAWAMLRASSPETIPSCWRIGSLLGITDLD